MRLAAGAKKLGFQDDLGSLCVSTENGAKRVDSPIDLRRDRHTSAPLFVPNPSLTFRQGKEEPALSCRAYRWVRLNGRSDGLGCWVHLVLVGDGRNRSRNAGAVIVTEDRFFAESASAE